MRTFKGKPLIGALVLFMVSMASLAGCGGTDEAGTPGTGGNTMIATTGGTSGTGTGGGGGVTDFSYDARDSRWSISCPGLGVGSGRFTAQILTQVPSGSVTATVCGDSTSSCTNGYVGKIDMFVFELGRSGDGFTLLMNAKMKQDSGKTMVTGTCKTDNDHGELVAFPLQGERMP